MTSGRRESATARAFGPSVAYRTIQFASFMHSTYISRLPGSAAATSANGRGRGDVKGMGVMTFGGF
jgi:hypothetical protein